jgi:SPP1 gp7 family putative phage head morphogenesis protein
MDDVLTNKFIKGYDPTHTTFLRNTFARQMSKRFNELVVVVKKSVDINDCFGLSSKAIQSLQMNPAQAGAFAFPRSAEKVAEFMKWLQKQVEAGIIRVGTAQQLGSAVNSAWTNMYILDSYKRGVIRARYEMKKAGLDIPSIDDSGGINIVMGLPFHIDRLGLLYSRVFTDLQGITTAMDSIISRILTQGLIDGDGPALLARKLVAAINGTGLGDLAIIDKIGRFIPAAVRAEMLARTEIIRAFAEAELVEFANWGIEGVSAQAEFQTAGDDRVCPICASLQGKVFTLAEASGVIPVHTRCRCCWLPYITDLQKYYN